MPFTDEAGENEIAPLASPVLPQQKEVTGKKPVTP
jgi:hypothetical protein